MIFWCINHLPSTMSLIFKIALVSMVVICSINGRNESWIQCFWLQNLCPEMSIKPATLFFRYQRCCRGMCSFQPGPSRPLSQCLVDLCLLSLFSHIWLFVTLRTIACQAAQSLGFSQQEYRSCHALFQGIFPTQGWTHISCIPGRFFTDWATCSVWTVMS